MSFSFVSKAQKDLSWGYINKFQADSLRTAMKSEKNDTLRMASTRRVGFYYQEYKADSALYFHEEQLKLAKKLGIKMWEADAYSQAAYVLVLLGNAVKAFDYFSFAEKIAVKEKNEKSNWREWTFSNAANLHESRIAILAMNFQMKGNIYLLLGDPTLRKESYWKAAKLGESINNGKIIYVAYASIANMLPADSAIIYYRKGLKAVEGSSYPGVAWGYMSLANAYGQKNMIDSAFVYANKGKAASLEANDMRTLSRYYEGLAGYYYAKKIKDSSLLYAQKSLEIMASFSAAAPELLSKYLTLAYAFALNRQQDSAIKYWEIAYRMSDSLRYQQSQNISRYQQNAFSEQFRMKAAENKIKLIGLAFIVVAILVVVLIQYRNNRQKQRANKVLEQTLIHLKATQAQLIQSEKMASLGELTAGIAHEIQNPLNFVNNFSEVNKELLEELKEEADKGNLDEVKAIAIDVINNEEKINHHGKRADAIVKGMLQHSRSSSGVKEQTDINALCDEYLRLSYHGLRAKDKSFNAIMKTNFDSSIGNINIIPQDIGRVVLNLLTNAFYAVDEKKKSPHPLKGGNEPYEPIVTIATKKLGSPLGGGGKVEIRVTDNGNGIPKKVLDKIFQPFFTTKPTGQGTGLGLSMSYDIITKGHNGELKVETKEGKGSTFIISLPN